METDDKQYDNARTIAIFSGNDGYYGIGEWDDNVKLKVKNIRQTTEGVNKADVMTPTLEVYETSFGTTAFKMRPVGLLSWTSTDATLKINMDGDIKHPEILKCIPTLRESKRNGQPVRAFDFSGRNRGEPNPFDSDDMSDVADMPA